MTCPLRFCQAKRLHPLLFHSDLKVTTWWSWGMDGVDWTIDLQVNKSGLGDVLVDETPWNWLWGMIWGNSMKLRLWWILHDEVGRLQWIRMILVLLRLHTHELPLPCQEMPSKSGRHKDQKGCCTYREAQKRICSLEDVSVYIHLCICI